MIAHILWTSRLVSIFLMIPLSLIAWLKTSKQNERGITGCGHSSLR